MKFANIYCGYDKWSLDVNYFVNNEKSIKKYIYCVTPTKRARHICLCLGFYKYKYIIFVIKQLLSLHDSEHDVTVSISDVRYFVSKCCYDKTNK